MTISELYDRSYTFSRVVNARGGPPLRIALCIDPKLTADPTAQLIAVAICNLLPRITERYTNVDLGISSQQQQLVIPRTSAEDLLRYLARTLRAATLCGQFREECEPNAIYDYCIVVGEDCNVTAKTVIHVWASGWRCFASKGRLATTCRAQEVLNPFACLAAASIALMILYHDAEGLQEFLHADAVDGWSLFDYTLSSDDGPELPQQIEVGQVVQAGLGGTANALLWALRYGPSLLGNWRGFEHEMLETSNANRYSLMDATDLGSKALLAQRRFGTVHGALHFEVVSDRIELKCDSLRDATLVVATVDDPQIRVALQTLGAGTILNVGTNSQWLSISRHEREAIRDGGACVECMYGENEQAPRHLRESTVSFVVALVGALLAGEFVKSYCFPRWVLSNSWLSNVFYPAQARTLLRPCVENCGTCLAIRT
jgi:hypothetical protein